MGIGNDPHPEGESSSGGNNHLQAEGVCVQSCWPYRVAENSMLALFSSKCIRPMGPTDKKLQFYRYRNKYQLT